MANRYATVNDTATVTEQSVLIVIDEITFIANDDATNDLYLSFERSIASGEDYIIVKAGETFTNLTHIKCHTLWFKASASTVAFRVIGMKVD